MDAAPNRAPGTAAISYDRDDVLAYGGSLIEPVAA